MWIIGFAALAHSLQAGLQFLKLNLHKSFPFKEKKSKRHFLLLENYLGKFTGLLAFEMILDYV